ncbi:MAG TPA: acetyl/propionyl/methylcrotonyl-CoA carboxylase subunit alpha [Bauldia sp.]|nr:acetyl/propionyl/methylcrotonyl-CoA carboxylase subunit alpha [Bauldia sp.]
MFRKILIANRGEIAVRITRTARRLGIATVAVYNDADRDAVHVGAADEAVHIGPAQASASYLAIDRIIEACRQTGADAVHPGYGFLSERADFAEALAAAGIAFIGPNAKAIAAMGDKIASKKLAAEARVSTIPGHPEAVLSEGEAVAVALAVGFPVMIKASAGGGGKGMRIAWNAEEAAEGWSRARSEAQSSFGDDRVFIERYVESPRHVEIQVLGDRHGNVIHLGERECSVQRRNQKIVEEAPSPAVDDTLREEMGAQAVALAKAVGYDSAGTVEFILAPDRRFYFLEMNTRLQVEHPVTELVTGIDLVEQMIRVAAGEPLSIRQEDVAFNGWAIEARVYAEDPYRGFLPSIGRLNRYRPPREGRDGEVTVRIDSGVEEGSEITLWFDPLIAKLVTHAPDRARAVEAMADALDNYEIDGVTHNQPFLAVLMDHPRWKEGRLSTGFIAEEFPEGFSGAVPSEETLQRLAAVALSIELAQRARLVGGADSGRIARPSRGEDWVVRLGDRRVPIRTAGEVSLPDIAFDVMMPGSDKPVTVVSDWRPGERLWTGVVGDFPLTVQLRPAVAGVRLLWRGVDIVARVMTPRVAALDALMKAKPAAGSSREVRCPMPGLVVSVLVAEGQEVRAGAPLAIVEAMKMENILRAERDGTVGAVKVKPGDVLPVDAVILELT